MQMLKDKESYRFLVVEDNPGDFVIVSDFLLETISNPVIIRAVNYAQCVKILLTDQAFSAILLDLSLPDKHGQDLITYMLKITSSCCPIIILTGYTDIGFSIKSISQGIMDYLLKDDLTASSLYKSIIYSIERKNNISELKASEKRYSDLFQLSPQPMLLFDPVTFRFVQVNKAASELYGYSQEEFLNMTLMDIKLTEDIAKAKHEIPKNIAGDRLFRETIRHHNKLGEIIEVEVYSTPIMINGRNFKSVIAIDVTEKNLQEQRVVKAIIKTQEDERYEIGGELHDNVCQILAASLFSLNKLKQSLPGTSRSLFDLCKDNIRLALDEIRNLSHRLAPAFFDDSTLEEAFRRLFNTFNTENKLKMSLHFGKAIGRYPLTLDIQLNLYRILQEQLRNIQKYAKATVVEVEVIIHNNNLKMKVSDNGIGFNVHEFKGGIGLANMKRRAELFSGKFKLDASPGKGCTIVVDIPLQEITPYHLKKTENKVPV
jgi:PAS domain S-box-containing protein